MRVSYSKYDMTAGENVGARKVVYPDSADSVKLAKADSESTLPCIGLTNHAANITEEVQVITNDVIEGFTGLTPGASYYLSQATAGELTTTKPTSGICIVIGTAVNTTEMDIHILRLYLSTSATESAEGILEIATQAETDAGTSDTKIITPLKLETKPNPKLDDLSTPEDNTDLDVSTAAHGLVPKLPDDATKYLNGVGGFTVPDGGGGDVKVAVDSGATADYLGASFDDGVLRTGNGIGYTDGGDFVTIALTTLMTDWDIGDGRMIKADKIQARGSGGLALYEYGGTGIFVKDSTGNVGINQDSPTQKLHVWSTTSADGILCDGNNDPEFMLGASGVVKARIGTVTNVTSYSPDSLAGDLVIRVEASDKRILFSATGGTNDADFMIGIGHCTAKATDAETATVLTPMSLYHKTSDNAVEGFGARLDFKFGDTGISNAILGSIAGVRGNADNKGKLLFYCGTDGIENFFTIGQDGGIHASNMKTGNNQTSAGAVAGELWWDSGDEHVIMGI